MSSSNTRYFLFVLFVFHVNLSLHPLNNPLNSLKRFGDVEKRGDRIGKGREERKCKGFSGISSTQATAPDVDNYVSRWGAIFYTIDDFS